MLTAQQAFKAGFLSRCIADRLQPEQIKVAAEKATALLEKNALFGLDGLVDKGWDAAKGLTGAAIGYGVPALALAPPIAGGLAGYGLAKATDIDSTDVDDIKDREVLDEYRRQTARTKRQTAARAYDQLRRRTGRMF